MTTQFSLLIDGGIIVLYLALVTAIGVYFSRRQRTLDDFVKGGKPIGFMATGLSLMAALNSGIDYIQIPAWGYRFGLISAVFVLTWLFIYPWITNVVVPFYRRLDVYSPYEYLERRFSLPVRLLGSSIYVLWRCGWMGAALYVPCVGIEVATGGAMPVTTTVVVLAVVVTVYTMLGGFHAVVWTDVIQFCIMFTGLVATVWYIFGQIPGGAESFWSANISAGKFSIVGRLPGWEEAGFVDKMRLYFFTKEVTFVGIMAGVGFNRLAGYTSDQVAVQRFQRTRSTAEARKAMVVNMICDVISGAALTSVGLALFAFYTNSGGFPAGLATDRVLTHFMANHFPVGLTGLVIAAILAASLASVDSHLNATTSVVVVDFYHRLFKGRMRPETSLDPQEQRRQIRFSRTVTVCLGGIVILFGANMHRFGEIWQGINRVLGAFGGPLFGIFVLGMFVRRAHATGALIGGLVGMTYNVYVSLIVRELSFQWTYPLGVIVTLAVGYLASVVLPDPRRGEEPLTWRHVMRMDVAPAPVQTVTAKGSP
jgi:SSS family transporter